MTQNQFKIMVVSIAMLFLISCMNMCNSCTTKTTLMEMNKKSNDNFIAAAKSSDVGKQEISLQFQTLAPEIANTILSYMNAELYKGVIQINNEKIKNLRMQIENSKAKNDTVNHPKLK